MANETTKKKKRPVKNSESTWNHCFPHRIKRPACLLTAVAFLVIILLLSVRKNGNIRDEQFVQPLASTVGDEERQPQENFVWSNELDDWALVESWEVDKTNLNYLQSNNDSLLLPERVWPQKHALDEGERRRDRIIDQLRLRRQVEGKYFKVMPARGSHWHPEGQQVFLEQDCLVNRCLITHKPAEADAILFQNSDVQPDLIRQLTANGGRPERQVWLAYLLESPPNTFDSRFERHQRGKQQFNWTASYRSDSDLVTPYSKFVPFRQKLIQFSAIKEIYRGGGHSRATRRYVRAEILDVKHKKLIHTKRKKVAWFASNCNAFNGRLEYARELSKYIQVDIYGKCGERKCDKSNEVKCLNMLNEEYKFYLAFENSNSREYVTEKLFKNALGYNNRSHLIVPIVMGPPREDYERLAPPMSFIHVDDFKSAKDLADYLNVLDKDDQMYYAYFQWKSLGRFIDTKFLCRLCAMLHEAYLNKRVQVYASIKDWWLRELRVSHT